MRDIKNHVDSVATILPQSGLTSTETGTGVDLREHDSAMVVIHSANADFTTTDETYVPTLEESDVLGSGYTTVAAADLDGAFSDLQAGSANQRVGYKGTKRYIRLVVTMAGTTPVIDLCAMIVRGKGHQQPLA